MGICLLKLLRVKIIENLSNCDWKFGNGDVDTVQNGGVWSTQTRENWNLLSTG